METEKENLNNIVDLTDSPSSDKTAAFQDLKAHIQKFIDNKEVFDTLSPDWKIDIRGGSRIKNHIVYSSKARLMNKAQKRRHNKYVINIKQLINNSLYTNAPKDNDKPQDKPNILKYHYFEVIVKMENKEYKIIINTEQYKCENTKKPQTVHLYDIIEIK